jgi:DNA topoisomerase VI subunit B
VQKKGTVKDVQGLLRHSRAATNTEFAYRKFRRVSRATIEAVSRELGRKPKQRKPSKSNVNLRPAALKLKKEKDCKLLKILVDLVGIEPTTSSMPWNEENDNLLTAKDLIAGQA